MTEEVIWFDADWKAWIKTNVENGQDKNGLLKTLLDEGFTYKSIHQAMQFEPSLPVEDLVGLVDCLKASYLGFFYT